MSSLSVEYNAINLGQGFPDFPMDEDLIELVHHHMKAGHNQYVHMNGLIDLRQAISLKVLELYDRVIDPQDEITITPGGTYAIYSALTALLQPGDEAIVFEPAYDSYIPNIEINGAKPILIPLSFPEYKINWQEVKNKISPKTRLIILNSPHNPSGSVLSAEDMEELSGIVRGTNIIILSDEVYEHLIFDGLQHQSILNYPELYKRSFVCFSLGKVYHCTGWKIGYCIAPPLFTSEFRKIHQFNCFSCNSPMQYAFADILKNKKNYLNLGSIMQEKRDLFKELMKQTRFKPLTSHGSYFQLYSYEGISQESESELAIRLTKEFGVATIPASAFYKYGMENKVLRFCFAKKEQTLRKAADRLKHF